MIERKSLQEFYADYHDEVLAKRYASPYALRRYAHEQQYQSIVNTIRPGERVLDAGCGDGILSVMLAQKGALVVGCDLSVPNIDHARRYAKEQGVVVDFLVGDAEHLPFPDKSFDVVVSCHVLEHLSDFDAGMREVVRLAKHRAVVAVPTALNGLSFVQLGGGWFYLKGPRSFLASIRGVLRVFYALITGQDGVDETYAGSGMPHVFRFPWVVRKSVRAAHATIVHQEASTLALPYFETLLPVSRFLDRFRALPVLRNLGYGTTFVIQPGDTAQ